MKYISTRKKKKRNYTYKILIIRIDQFNLSNDEKLK